MSGPKGIQYSVEQVAAMQEAAELSRARSRLRVLSAELDEVLAQCSAVERADGESFDVPLLPTEEPATSTRARQLADALASGIAGLRHQLYEANRQQRREQIAAALRAQGPLNLPGQAASARRSKDSANDVSPPEGLDHRIDRCLARLDPEVQLPERFQELALRLREAPGPRAELALRSLQEEVGRLNRLARRRARVVTTLHELDVRAGAIDDPAPQTWVAAARAEGERLDDARLLELEAEIESAEQAAAAKQKRTQVLMRMGSVLSMEGYEVLAGFETLVPEEGLLVRKPRWGHHGLLVGVDDEEVTLRVVRSALESDPASTAVRDEEAEVEMCDDLPAIREGLAAAGIRTERVRAAHAGDVPVQVLPGADLVARDSGRVRKPKERSL